MNKTLTQFRTSTAPKKCIIRHYVECLIEGWTESTKKQPNKNRCVWDLEREG